jgi:hypothetical protein
MANVLKILFPFFQVGSVIVPADHFVDVSGEEVSLPVHPDIKIEDISFSSHSAAHSPDFEPTRVR